MSPESLESIDIQTGDNPRHTVIWLHGLGADGHDFLGLVPELGIPDDKPVRFVFPHAPMRPITINGGMVMRGWYDIADMSINRAEDAEGIHESAELIRALIGRETERGFDSRHVILAGFSQGGAIALHAALRYDRPLGGILALSTYVPLADSLPKERNSANQACRIFMAHGLHDPVIPVAIAEQSHRLLQSLDYDVEWQTYAMPHAVCPQEIGDLRRFFIDLIS